MGVHKGYQFFMVFIFSFALKDDEMSIGGSYFTGSDEKIKFSFEEGIKVVAFGKLTNFSVLSNRQIVMKTLCY
ncbi:exodeoxyribonuclease VII large subunit [Bartonella sp. AP7XZML]|uniref:exodeoxyribonuclease VII large subunit n=1 Tax=Bartonella sp. AP7XZML TaxID=3243503 RepID=UPI0035CE9E7E